MGRQPRHHRLDHTAWTVRKSRAGLARARRVLPGVAGHNAGRHRGGGAARDRRNPSALHGLSKPCGSGTISCCRPSRAMSWSCWPRRSDTAWSWRPTGGSARQAQHNALVALFSGPSGTGKTMAAGLIARGPGCRFIGWTVGGGQQIYRRDRKAIRRVLREAEAPVPRCCSTKPTRCSASAPGEGRAGPLRQQEIAFLLQRIEAFDGLVILTTNLGPHRSGLPAADRLRGRFPGAG